MKAIIFVSFFLSVGFSSCKKNYTCECKNANASYPAGEIETTRSKAKKYCQDLSTADTKCNIQQ